MIISANTYIYIIISYISHLNNHNYQFTNSYKDLNVYIMNLIFFSVLIKNLHDYLLILHYNSSLNHLTDLCKKEINTADIMMMSCYYVQHAEQKLTYNFSRELSAESEKKILKNDIVMKYVSFTSF